MKPIIAVKEIWQENDRTLSIVWTDERHSKWDVVHLRKACPCAVCIDELTGKQKLDVASIKDSVRPDMINSIGRYALSIRFDDGHNTGIYTFDMLRKLAG